MYYTSAARLEPIKRLAGVFKPHSVKLSVHCYTFDSYTRWFVPIVIRVCVNGYSSAMRPSGRTYFKTMRLFRYLCVIDAGRTCRLYPGITKSTKGYQTTTFEWPTYICSKHIKLKINIYYNVIHCNGLIILLALKCNFMPGTSKI